jgi:hypothetical protein
MAARALYQGDPMSFRKNIAKLAQLLFCQNSIAGQPIFGLYNAILAHLGNTFVHTPCVPNNLAAAFSVLINKFLV